MGCNGQTFACAAIGGADIKTNVMANANSVILEVARDFPWCGAFSEVPGELPRAADEM